MGWTEISERSRSGGDMEEAKIHLKKIKQHLVELCEILEDEDSDFGERGNMGERRAWRIEEDDRYGDRRGVRGSGRGSRY